MSRPGSACSRKGPVAVFLPAVVFFIYLASQKRLGDLRHMMLPTGALISLAIVVPWYYFLYREHGWEYIGAFIFGENLERYAEAVGEQSRGMLFYLPVMLADLFPVVAADSGRALVGGSRRACRIASRGCSSIWIAAIVVFFSLSGTKEDLYILPIVPAEAALIGAMLAKAIDSEPCRRAGAWFTARRPCCCSSPVGGTVGVRCGASVLAGRRGVCRGGGPRRRARRPRAGCSAARSSRRSRRSPRASSSSAGASCSARCPISSATSRSGRSPTSSDRARASARSSGRTSSRCRAWSSTSTGPSWRWCFPIIFARCSIRAATCISSCRKPSTNSIKDRLPVKTYVLARQQMFDLKPKNFLDGSELPQFVLVSES